MSYSLAQIAAALDATNLKLDATGADLETLCHTAVANRVAAVCVYPTSVALCRKILGSSEMGLAAVIGFPSGRFTTRSKAVEIDEVAAMGASEVDIVLNYAALLAGQSKIVATEAASLADVCRKVGLVSKFIVETCSLNRDQKIAMLRISEDAGADFIKTSTGFAQAGADPDDIRLWKESMSGNHLRIKASGGIRTRDQVETFLKAGASRIGLSSVEAILGDESVRPVDGDY